jgi:thiamine transport system substrate-binding protein
VDAGIFDAYQPRELERIPQVYRMDPQNRVVPVDEGAVCLNDDPAWFSAHGLAVPASLEDLARPEYKGLLVVENPATSSPGLAFLLATIAHFGEGGYLDYWRALRANGAVVVDGWNTAYYTNFSGSSGRGPQPLVVSYATSPVAELIYAATPLPAPPTGAILAPDTCFRQVEFAGILTGTKNRDLAERFIDFLLSLPYQEDIPLQNLMFPVRPDAKLPDSFVNFAPKPDKPASVPPEEIASHRDAWIRDWTTAMLK